jgi:hypothetical protein
MNVKLSVFASTLLPLLVAMSLHAQSNGISITAQPQSQVAVTGSTATFTVTATGAAPLVYQWRFNGTNLSDNGHVSGSVSNVLTLNNAVAGDTGNYDVIITNSYGLVTSSVATLTVTNPNILINGSFEDPVLPANTGAYIVPTGWMWAPGLASAPALAGGMFTAGSAQYGPAEDGRQWLGIGSAGDGSLSQLVTVTTAGNYQLTWYATVGNEGQSSGTSPYEVSLGTNGGQFDAGTSLGGTWEPQSHLLSNLAAGQYTLTFTPETPQGGFATIIDNVSLMLAQPVLSAPQFQPATITGANNEFSFGWSTVVGAIYQVQYKDILTQSNWINLGAPIVAGGTNVMSSDGLTNSQRFYRIMLLP